MALQISDNGIGFDSKYAEDIFMPFKRLHSYDEFKGNGIGLAICKKNMEKNNGFITVDSHVGQGTTFLVLLPESRIVEKITPV
jgi:light-regulated signal transduction histidine kinase (bacteriophytochrome)